MRKRSIKMVRRAPARDRRRRTGEDEPTVTATIITHEPDASFADGVALLSDALVLQGLDPSFGETIRMAYTMLHEHQARDQRRAVLAAAADALRAHLAQLDEACDNP